MFLPKYKGVFFWGGCIFFLTEGVLYVLKFSRRQNSLNFSRADSPIRWLTDFMNHLTRLFARENFTENVCL
jgi:hypothetical protein